MNDEVGGYFGLELPLRKSVYYPDAMRYQSARAAFYALLCAGRPNTVWAPRYICDAMLSPLYKAQVDVRFYSINDDFSIKENIGLGEHAWLLYVNYFGVCKARQLEILSKYNPRQVVLDHAQAFFAPPANCLATIYSPRKFFGIPDGGLLVTDLSINDPVEMDTTSINRMSHLIQRIAFTPESGYAAFQLAEVSLEQFEPKKLSALTARVMAGIDFDAVKERRNSNFRFLHEALAKLNELQLNIMDVDGPLCYPFLNRNGTLRSHLLEKRIFLPSYWPECLQRSQPGSFEYMYVNSLLPLPCDQRWGRADLLFVATSIIDAVGHG